MHTTNFKVIKGSSWGIVIDISCDYLLGDGAGLITLDFKHVEYLTSDEKCCLNQAVELFARKSGLAITGKNRNLVIVINKIEFNPCDYQPEGLKWALIQWINEVFDLNISYENLHFNKKLNKYEFGA